MPTDPWPEALSVEIDRNQPGMAVVRLRGEIDLVTCETLREALAGIDDAATVTVDLRGLDFMDSSGIRCLLDADRAARERGVDFRLIDGAAVSGVLDVSGVRPYLDFVEAPPSQAG
jgi:anti-sigma B factor antagonist